MDMLQNLVPPDQRRWVSSSSVARNLGDGSTLAYDGNNRLYPGQLVKKLFFE
jgi:hypothetical protein